MSNSYNQQLVDARKKKRLTIKDAAKKIGISRFKLFLYENGYFRPGTKSIDKIQNFYEMTIDYSNNNEYPTAGKVVKKRKSRKRRIIISSIICGLSVGLIITGSLLFTSSAKNRVTSYGDVYNETRQKAIEGGKVGRDLITDLQYYYVDNNEQTARPTIAFYDTNNILYFNKCTYTTNVIYSSIDPSKEVLGVCRLYFSFGGGLSTDSRVCSLTFASSSGGVNFTCDAYFTNEEIKEVRNLKIISQTKYKVTEELALFVYNAQRVDLVRDYNHLLFRTLGREVDFYYEFLPAREQGRITNFNMQITGLSLLFPAIIAFFITATIIIFTLIGRAKSLLAPIEETHKDEGIYKPLPKDYNIYFGIPDFVVINITRIMGFGGLGLMALLTGLKLIVPLPAFLTSEGLMRFLSLCFISAPFIYQIVMIGSIKKTRTLFKEITKYMLLYLTFATIETTILGIADAWGYEIASLLAKYIPTNIFLATALNYFIFYFLFLTPKFIRKKGKYGILVWRLLSIVPLVVITVITVIGHSYVMIYGVKNNVYLNLWISNSKIDVSIVSILIIYVTYFIRLFFTKRYGHNGAITFHNGNRYMFVTNITYSAIIVAFVLIDLFFINSEFFYYLGLGDNIWMLMIIPLVLFCKYGPNSIEISGVDDDVINTI